MLYHLKYITALVSCLYLSLTTAHAQEPTGKEQSKAISVVPAKLRFSVDKGESQTISIDIKNGQDTMKAFKLYLGDWERDSLGNHHFFEGEPFEHSCSRWISLDQTYIEVPAHSNKIVTVKMNVPDSEEAVKEMKWTMLFVEAAGDKAPPQRTGAIQTELTRTFRLGIHIYQTPPGNMNKELKMLGFKPLKERGNYRMEFKNTGGTQLECTASIDLTSEATGEKTSIEYFNKKAIPLFPGQYRVIDFSLPANLPSGKYSAIALLDAGDDEIPLEAAQLEVEVK